MSQAWNPRAQEGLKTSPKWERQQQASKQGAARMLEGEHHSMLEVRFLHPIPAVQFDEYDQQSWVEGH